MKKIIKYNIIGIIIILILSEIICFIIAVKSKYPIFGKNTIKYVLSCYVRKEEYRRYDLIPKYSRPVSGINYKRKPILLFGCSVTYGNGLNDNNNFSAILSRETKRPVYNIAQDGWTISHMYKQLQENKEIENTDPEFIIFTYIHDHKKRLYFYQGWPPDTGIYLRYTYDKNKNLVANKKVYPFYNRFLIVKYLQFGIAKLKYNNKEKTTKLTLDLFEKSAIIMKKKYPNAKLIMLLYRTDNCGKNNDKFIYPPDYFLSEYELNKLKNMGYDIRTIEGISKRTFCTQEYKVDEFHPSSKMWEEFVPSLVKEYKM